MKPTLRPAKLHWTLSDYPEGTAFDAGYLTTKNAGWRSQRPVIDTARCTGCLQCYLYCPDGVLRSEGKTVAVDLDFCKGCGICARICPARAIEMEAEAR